jgi:hypothetical protein
VHIEAINHIQINDQIIAPKDVQLMLDDKELCLLDDIQPEKPLNFPLRRRVRIVIENKTLAQGKHQIQLGIAIQQLGEISFDVEDLIEVGNKPKPIHIPRNEDDDYSNDAIQQRQAFIEQQTQKHLKHVNHFSFPASVVQGNIENFTGVAQIPLGIAGPIHINGEAAQGEFLVPLATTEGTLVASYNRGIKLLNHSGGVNTTVVDDAMQRAPVFVFQSARHARDFVDWVEKTYRISVNKQKQHRVLQNCATSRPSSPVNSLTCASTSRQAMRQGRTWSGVQPSPLATGLCKPTINIRLSISISNPTSPPTRNPHRSISCIHAVSASLPKQSSSVKPYKKSCVLTPKAFTITATSPLQARSYQERTTTVHIHPMPSLPSSSPQGKMSLTLQNHRRRFSTRRLHQNVIYTFR